VTGPLAFVDSWHWVAQAVVSDPAHGRATALRREAEARRVHLVTSSMVMAETLTRLRYDFGLSAALRMDYVWSVMAANAVLDVVHVGPECWRDSMAWFRRFADQHFSFVDCTSFAIMAQRGITEALTGDRHFAAAGFVALGAL